MAKDNGQKGGGKAPAGLDSAYIRAWCQEWEVHPDIRGWILEAYAKAEDESAERALLRLLNAAARAQQDRLKAPPPSENFRKIEWKEGRD